MTPKATEYNFDGLIGPTHNYAGLSYGNLPSTTHQFEVSHPKQAALEGLHKMKLLFNLGVKQGFLPPQLRPSIQDLKRLGFSGPDKQILKDAYQKDPTLLYQLSSSSSMWAANAATVSPSADTADHKCHITVANLINQAHRTIEAEQTYQLLKHIFHDTTFFTVHSPIPTEQALPDEGAANHLRFAPKHANSGIELFVYGKTDTEDAPSPKCFPARQHVEASQFIANAHQLKPDHVLFAQQNPLAIDQGVFHNDLISVSNESVFLVHEAAFLNTSEVLSELQDKYLKISKDPLHIIQIKESDLSVAEAVKTFIFNSQIITVNDKMVLVAPTECETSKQTQSVIQQILKADNPITHVEYVNVRQSMQNGGGPACLRLRVVLTEEEAKAVHRGYILNEEKFDLLESWIHKYYQDSLEVKDLQNIDLYQTSQQALTELKGHHT